MKMSTLDIGDLLLSLSLMGIKRKLESLTGIYAVAVDLMTQQAKILYDENKTQPHIIRQKIIEVAISVAVR